MADVLLKGVGGGGISGSEIDERVAAKAALEAAEEQLQSLCKYCPTTGVVVVDTMLCDGVYVCVCVLSFRSGRTFRKEKIFRIFC